MNMRHVRLVLLRWLHPRSVLFMANLNRLIELSSPKLLPTRLCLTLLPNWVSKAFAANHVLLKQLPSATSSNTLARLFWSLMTISTTLCILQPWFIFEWIGPKPVALAAYPPGINFFCWSLIKAQSTGLHIQARHGVVELLWSYLNNMFSQQDENHNTSVSTALKNALQKRWLITVWTITSSYNP